MPTAKLFIAAGLTIFISFTLSTHYFFHAPQYAIHTRGHIKVIFTIWQKNVKEKHNL